MNQNINFQIANSNQIEKFLGEQIRNFRLLNNNTQVGLARNAGISTRTLQRMENGEGVSMDTFIRVLQVFGLQENLKILIPDASIRPVDRVRFKGRERKRARPLKRPKSRSTWTWGLQKKNKE